AAASRESVLHAPGVRLVPAPGPALAGAISRGPRSGVAQRRARALRDEGPAHQGAAGEPRGERSRREEGRVIRLWELRGKGDRRYSLFSWRTRMALRHKGLEFQSTPVAMSETEAIAFSGSKTEPVIR